MAKRFFVSGRSNSEFDDPDINSDYSNPSEESFPMEDYLAQEDVRFSENDYKRDESNEGAASFSGTDNADGSDLGGFKKHNRIKKYFLRPVAAAAVGVTTVLASFWIDPLGHNYFGDQSDSSSGYYDSSYESLYGSDYNPFYDPYQNPYYYSDPEKPDYSDPEKTDPDSGVTDYRNDPRYIETYRAVSIGDNGFPILPNPDPDWNGDYSVPYWSTDSVYDPRPIYCVRYVDYGVRTDKMNSVIPWTYVVNGSYWDDDIKKIEGIDSVDNEDYQVKRDRKLAADGISYDSENNVLRLNNAQVGLIDVNLMGNNFTIELTGENVLDGICVWGWYRGGSLTITGSGSAVINSSELNQSGIVLKSEESPSCLMIDGGVTVEVHSWHNGDVGAFRIYNSTMENGVFLSGSHVLTGGYVVRSDEVNEHYDGDEYFYSARDDNGLLASVVTFEPNGQ